MDLMWSVCGIRSKEIANGAAALAINVHDVMASGNSIEQLGAARGSCMRIPLWIESMGTRGLILAWTPHLGAALRCIQLGDRHPSQIGPVAGSGDSRHLGKLIANAI
jgi:hypothetical protein